MENSVKLSILMPVRNEGVNIKIMIRILNCIIEVPYELLVVYDDPDDDCVPIVEKSQKEYPCVKLVHNTRSRGVGSAIMSGAAVAKGEYVLLFAVDEMGPVLAVEDMIALMDEGCDMVSCTRYAYGGKRLGGSIIGGILSRMANKLFYILAGANFTDGTTGIKMFKKKVLDNITIESNPAGWAAVFELAIKVQMAGLKIGEVPIVSIDRLYGGRSTFSLGPWLKEYLKWFLWGIGRLRQAKRPEKSAVRIPLNMAGNR